MKDDLREMRIQLIMFEDVYLDTLRHAEGWESARYQEASAILHLSPNDIKKLDVKNGSHLQVVSSGGSIVVKIKSDPHCDEGYGCIPSGLYSNYLAGHDPYASKVPSLKAMEVTLSPTQQEVTPFSEVLPEKRFA